MAEEEREEGGSLVGSVLGGPVGAMTGVGSQYTLVTGLASFLRNSTPTAEGMEERYGVNPDEVRGVTPTTAPPATLPTGESITPADDAAEDVGNLFGVSGATGTESGTDRGLLSAETGSEDFYYIPPEYRPPARAVVGPDGRRSITYTGPNRVTGSGTFERDRYTGGYAGAYDINNEWLMELTSLSPSDRKMLFDALHDRGMYGGSKPSTTYLDPGKEGRVMKMLMYVANLEGRTWDVVAMRLIREATVKPERSISRRDINRFLQSAAQSMIGRNLRPKEADRVAGAAQSAYAAGLSGAEAAQQAVEAEYRPEADAYEFSKYADLMGRLMR